MRVFVTYMDGLVEPYDCDRATAVDGVLRLRCGPISAEPFVSIPTVNVRRWTQA